MGILSRFESSLGLTRGDVTVALFLAATAIAGVVYITFFDGREPDGERKELLLLTKRHDSILAIREASSRIEPALSVTDSVPEWTPLGEEDAVLDSLEDVARSPKKGSGRKELPTSPVDLNSAPKAELMRLPGVGEKTAEAIMVMRKHVPFRRPEDIMNVKGIGEKKFAKMKPYITVR